jgi:RimJ/RimL family protein N-acetyltransferase
MLGWTDFLKFERACRDSQKELTEYLSLGEGMDQYLSLDYWNLFGALLKDQTLDLFGLLDGEELLGVASYHKARFELGCQIVYWIRGGYHGKGLGVVFMYMLLREALGRKKLLFAELIIDQENQASISVAEQLCLDRVDEWERKESGQGQRNSGKFFKYHAYENIFLQQALKEGMTPLELLENFWRLWNVGIDARQFLPYRRKIETPTLRSTLRLVT